jgi:hypothetical protein
MNVQSQPKIIASFAGALLNGAGVKVGIKLLRDGCHARQKVRISDPQHLDGKVARVLNERGFLGRQRHGATTSKKIECTQPDWADARTHRHPTKSLTVESGFYV